MPGSPRRFVVAVAALNHFDSNPDKFMSWNYFIEMLNFKVAVKGLFFFYCRVLMHGPEDIM